MGNAAQRKIIRLKAVLHDDFLCAGHCAEMSADQTVYSTFTDVSFRIAVLIPCAETCTGNNREMLGRMCTLIPSEESLMQLYRVFNANERVDTDTVAITYETDCLVCRHNTKHDLPPFGSWFHLSLLCRPALAALHRAF